MEVLTVHEVCHLLKVSRETLRRWEIGDTFPRRRRLSSHPRGKCGWLRSEIEAWLNGRLH